MYINARSALVRNLAVAGVNGAITYVILIIAPMGLMGVFVNTALVAIASFVTATMADRVVIFLQGGRSQPLMRDGSVPGADLEVRRTGDLDRYRRRD
jgi:hypothetical protein